MIEREQLLLIYSQISLQFIDLHDRAGRMHAKGTIRQPLRWQNARRFFYWRLRSSSAWLLLLLTTPAHLVSAPRLMSVVSGY
ncbi:hypothetical protein V2W45_1413459 [Cenococcum geophilum]